MNRTTPSSAGPRGTTVNQRWKALWKLWVVRSVVAAAMIHAAVFAFGPVWDVDEFTTDAPSTELLQITPVATALAGSSMDGERGAVAGLPSVDELELALEAAREARDEETEVNGGISGARSDRGVDPLIPSIVRSNSTERLEAVRVILDRLSEITPGVASIGTVTWPRIRNPTVIRRYLRSRYNPLHDERGAKGTVSVVLWIDERGTVSKARVSESSGTQALDEIAVVLFQDVARFSPARSGSSTVPIQVTVSVPLTLPW